MYYDGIPFHNSLCIIAIVEPLIKETPYIRDTIQELNLLIIKDKFSCPKLYL